MGLEDDARHILDNPERQQEAAAKAARVAEEQEAVDALRAVIAPLAEEFARAAKPASLLTPRWWSVRLSGSKVSPSGHAIQANLSVIVHPNGNFTLQGDSLHYARHFLEDRTLVRDAFVEALSVVMANDWRRA